MEELKRVQGSRFDEFQRRRLIENQDTIHELTARIQKLQNEVNCLNDSRDFKDAKSVRSGLSHVPSQPASLPPFRDPGGMLSRPGGKLSRNDKPPDIWDTHVISGNVFANPPASSSSPSPQESNPWISNVSEHTTACNERTPNTRHCFWIRDASQDRQPENSFDPSEGRFSKNCGADQQRLQISDPHFDKFTTSAMFVCWKIRFKTEVCTCSQFLMEAMLWIKEVEMVESVDDLMSSSSIRGIQMPNFEVLDARIASALNRIIHNSQFKRRISPEGQKAQKEDRFLRGRQIAYLIYEYFRVTGANDSVENYADFFTIGLRNDENQEFDSKWDGILLSTTKIPPNDILEGLYKLRIRESEKLKTVLELYDLEIHEMKIGPDYHRLKTMFLSMTKIPHDDILEGLYKLRKREFEKLGTVWELYDLETHQKKLGPDYHRLKATVKRSIEQDLRNGNFGARNGNYERNAVVKNQGTKQRGQRILGDCWQWEANGQCAKGDNCSFRHDIKKRGKSSPSNPSQNSFMQQNERITSRTQSPRGKSPSGRMSRWPCKDYLKGTGTNSFCEKWHPPECLFYKTKSGCRFGEKCSYAHRQVDEQLTKRSKKNYYDKSAVAMLKKHMLHDRTGQPVVDQASQKLPWIFINFTDTYETGESFFFIFFVLTFFTYSE